MTKDEAAQVAKLLNDRNQLVKKLTFRNIIEKKENYVTIKEGKEIIACAESKKVQWYQWEISHVSVAENHEGKGLGNRVLKLAEDKAVNGNARILQCTIRTNNESSIRLFTRKGYKQVSSFYYTNSGNWVFVYQKAISVLEG